MTPLDPGSVSGLISGVRDRSHSIHRTGPDSLCDGRCRQGVGGEFANASYTTSNNGYGMAVVPACTNVVDMKRLAGVLGADYVRLATEAELADLFPDCELGAMPPFGNVYLMPVVVDYDVARNEFIEFTLGTHRDAIRMSFNDYKKVARPLMAGIAMEEAFA